MPQSPIPAQAYGRDPDLNFKPLQVDVDGYAIPSATNDPVLDVVGALADAAVVQPSTTDTMMAYIKGLLENAEQAVATSAAVITNGLALFTVSGGPVEIVELFSINQTANDATASTLQFQSAGTLGTTTQTISGASASLANAAAGTSVIMQGTALATAPLVNANGAGITAVPGSIIAPAGSIKAVVGVGSTTGTWKHYIRYRPLAPGAKVVAAF